MGAGLIWTYAPGLLPATHKSLQAARDGLLARLKDVQGALASQVASVDAVARRTGAEVQDARRSIAAVREGVDQLQQGMGGLRALGAFQLRVFRAVVGGMVAALEGMPGVPKAALEDLDLVYRSLERAVDMPPPADPAKPISAAGDLAGLPVPAPVGTAVISRASSRRRTGVSPDGLRGSVLDGLMHYGTTLFAAGR